MKGLLKYLLAGVATVFLFTACAKQPAQEINSAKAAVDAAISEGAEKYSPVEAKKLNDELSSAMNEVKTQDAKFLKKYDKAVEMLAKVKADAEALKAGLAVKKEEAKKNALLAQESARAAVDEVKALAAKLPKGKSKADTEVVQNDIKGLEEALPDVQKLIEGEDYTAAVSRAAAVKEKAAGMTEQLRKVPVKAETKKEAKQAATKKKK